jgi:imidazolonepropionase-like amidohydrolase
MKSRLVSVLRACMLPLLTCAVTVCPARAQQPAIVIQDARLVPVSGPAIERGSIVLADGRIRAVGIRVVVPAGAVVVDGTGLTVYPGLIDAFTDLGVGTGADDPEAGARRAGPARGRGPQDRPASSPWVQAADEFRPEPGRIERWRQAGFTAVVAAPSGGILPGQAAVLSLSDRDRPSTVLRAGVALPIHLRPVTSSGSFPGSLMGVIAYLRQTFLDVRHAGHGGPDDDRTVTTLQEALRAQTPVLLPGGTAVEIDRMVRFGRELDVPFMIYGGHGAAAVVSDLAQGQIPVLLSARWPATPRETHPEAVEPRRVREFRERAPASAAALAAAAVPFAFYSGGLTDPGAMLMNVRAAIDAGLSRQAALRALTLTPARLYGVDDRLGSLEPGKMAHLVVTAGDLFEASSVVRYVFVDGRRFDVPVALPPVPPALPAEPTTAGHGGQP